MVVVCVGDEDRVDVHMRLVDGAGVAVERPEPVDEQRIREDAGSVQVEEHRRVPEEPEVRARERHEPSLIGG